MVPLPGKRHRAPTDLEDEEDYDFENEGPSNRRDSRKRQRVSTASEEIYEDGDEDTVLSDTHQNEIEDLLENGYDSAFFNDLAVNPDTGEVDVDGILGNETARMAALKSIVEKRFKRLVDNYPAENAIIEEVKCVNFMCHAHLTVTLGPLINFIIGHNGSGKSAVMTALTLCLGGKATSTNRGGSLKSFIKEGEDAAMLAVRIKNQGSSAFRPELYGKSIIVERHFNRNGASGFKIKNAKEKVVSTKKMDLEDIIDAFQLQMDNPMNVLSQDMARQFLNHSTPSDKYKFFLEGTQIATLDRDYRILEEYLNEIEAKKALKQQDTETLRKQKEKAEEKLRAYGRQAQLVAKKNLLERQYAWKQVEIEEAKVEDAEREIARAEAEIEQKTAEVEAASNSFDRAVREYKAAEEEIQKLERDKRPTEDRLDEAQTVFNKGKEDLQGVMAQQRQIKSALKGDGNMITRIENDIREERRRQEGENGGEHAQRLQEWDEAKAKVREKQAAYDQLRNDIPALENQRAAAQDHLNEYQATIEGKRDDVRQQEQHIQDIRRNQGKWMAGFDQNLPALLRAIDSETRFRTKPVGPVGRYVRLLKPEWSAILEKSAGTQLNAFVVTSKHDEGILRELMRRTNYPRDGRNNTPVLIGDPRPLDTSRNEPEHHLLTWDRALKIEHPLVRNQLIINNMIDQTVLIEDPEEAFQFAYGSSSGENQPRPQNVKQVFTMSRDKRDGTRYGWASSGAGQQGPIMTQKGRHPRMQSETESQLNVANEELRQYKLDLQQAENEWRQRQEALTRAKQALERCKREFQTARYEHQSAQEEEERLRDIIEQEAPQAGRLEELERQLQEAKAAKQTNTEMYADAQAERDRIDAEQKERKQKIEQIGAELAEIDTKITKAEIRLNGLEEKRLAALHDKNQAFEAIELAQEQLADFQRQLERLQQDIATFSEQAQEVGDRPEIPANETVEGLGRKYEKLQQEISVAQQRLGGSEDELKQARWQAFAAYKNATKAVTDMETAIHVLKQALVSRRVRLILFKRTIADRSRITFTYLLTKRKFRGDLRIDQKAKELDLSVEPDMTRTDASGRQTKTLSGGEKSFSTVCLLLALWDAMGAPTRCLDEFDVFMDSVNRDISMKMIIEACF
ncbi:hypothetical protein B0J12DRAFT_678244 [Macrophomina phaseolina]|uniref:RecF/RecN/SMC N-terminal domain-containing protein n=1 Tax=Macrophomina phaseolina TaxID=35725 RepID=A0ABQ8FZI2_9PEZI|nr:hypothetical protein B0J12DRAFT_678244 [Macrophomina phaseolina]